MRLRSDCTTHKWPSYCPNLEFQKSQTVQNVYLKRKIQTGENKNNKVYIRYFKYNMYLETENIQRGILIVTDQINEHTIKVQVYTYSRTAYWNWDTVPSWSEMWVDIFLYIWSSQSKQATVNSSNDW